MRIVHSNIQQGGGFCHGAFFAIKRELFFQANGFNLKYTKASVEDVEFSARLSAAGFSINLVPGLSVTHDKKFTLKSILLNDFYRTADRVEFVLNAQQILRIAKNRRFEQANLSQLIAILLTPLFWLSIVVCFTNASFLLVIFLIVILFAGLNISQLKFNFTNRGLWFAGKTLLFYFLDLGVVFLGIAKGLFTNLKQKATPLKYFSHLKHFLVKRQPVELTYFVTNKCNARCSHCFYSEHLKTHKQLLTIPEIQKTFSFARPLLRVLLSGGEPFVRTDLVEVILTIYHACKPRHITIPTNGILTDNIVSTLTEVLPVCQDSLLNISISLDDLFEERDSTMGVTGSFEQTLETYYKLKTLKTSFPNLMLGVIITQTHSNQNNLDDIYDYAKKLS